MTGRPSTAKRSPSILVTDVRQGHKSAPFVKSNQSGGGSSRFNQISIDNILSDVSEIPSAQRRSPPNASSSGVGSISHSLLQRRGGGGGGGGGTATGPNASSGGGGGRNKPPLIGAGSRTHVLANTAESGANKSQGAPQKRSVSGMVNSAKVGSAKLSQRPRRNSLPPRMGAPTIPSRTTKMSERLVLIPEDEPPRFRFQEDEDEDEGPPKDQDVETMYAFPKRSFAERVSKDKRDGKFPRVTAYCISDAVRLQAVARFLRDQHKIRPRIYDEALFAPYYLPLLPGDEEGYSRIKSSPGGIQMLETLINLSEQDDHHYEYYSGLESSSKDNEISATAHDYHDDESEEFDPSEPQDFSPADRGEGEEYMKQHVNGGRAHDEGEDDENPGQNTDIQNDVKTDQENTEHVQRASEPTAKHDSDPDDTHHAEIFIFSYGVILFWNFTEKQEKDVLADLTFGRSEDGKPLVIRPIDDQDIETEDLHFTYSPETRKPRIYNDMITLKSGDHMIKLAMSHAIAQSTKLSRFEARMDLNMHDVKHVPKMLALTGKLGMNREEILKMSGKLFKLRVDVNLSSNVLDTPEFFWEAEPSLNPMYSALREYLEIEPRILVLNERCKTFLELTDIIADSIAESNMSRITWIIIILIALSLGVSTIEILVRFTILNEK